MTRPVRLTLFWLGTLAVAAMLMTAFVGLPHFGNSFHPYGDMAVRTAVHMQHETNVVGSVTFDLRGLDTMGEEFIFFASVLGGAVLLRRMRGEAEESGQLQEYGPAEVFDGLRLAGYVLLPITLLAGIYLVAHGHLSPGGGFQGGVVLATAVHIIYLAGDYPALERIRPMSVFEIGEAVGAGGFVALGLAGIASGASFLSNILPRGQLRDLASAGTILPLNTTVGLEVSSGTIILLAYFLEQALVVRGEGETSGEGAS